MFFSSGCRGQIILSDHKTSDYRIIIPENAQPPEIRAGLELQKHIEGISGAFLPLVADTAATVSHEIILGKSSRLHHHKIKTGFKKTNHDGFLILTKDEKLFITGNTPQGTLNGVYTFLEKYLDCRLYSPSVKIIPEKEQIILPGIRDRQEPVFSFRELHFPAKYDTSYLAWHKLHTHHDGSWGMWVHTFDDLVPPDTYFEAHPEYFSEINGTRQPHSQLCLTNTEVFDTLVKNLEKKINGRPDAQYWSVSQNDNFLACQCENCTRVAEELGGQSGLMLQFVNRVAERFPDKTISTLAYQYTRSAPEKIRPLPNVNIMFCSIECNRSKPLAKDPTSASFVKDMKDWTQLTHNILIWDYVVQFRNYVGPFPNLRVLQPNLEFFAKYGCQLMFQQGSGSSFSEFVDLRSYLIAKLLWDPGLDPDEIMKDFIEGYYGQAAPFITEYIKTLHDELERADDNLWIYGFPYSGFDSFLKPGDIANYTSLFQKAVEAVADDSVMLDRVIYARLPLDFAILDISLHQVNDTLSWLLEKDGQLVVNEEMTDRLDTFIANCNRLNVNTLNEQGYSADDYGRTIRMYLDKSAGSHLGLHKSVSLLTASSPKYEAGGAGALTDGIRGIDDYHFNWLGFEGNDMEAVIDLGEEKTISAISADFLQDNRAWIFLPQWFFVSVSTDNENYSNIGSARNTTSDRKAGSFIRSFSVKAESVQARYIKVKAQSLKTCPSWHIGSGKNAWIFVDEIVIK
jgi:hypothetical protein